MTDAKPDLYKLIHQLSAERDALKVENEKLKEKIQLALDCEEEGDSIKVLKSAIKE